jgi:ABC-type Fe3+ transport system permease subunit
VWRRTGESLWEEAAVPALMLVLAGLVPVILLVRSSEPGRAVLPARLPARDDDR